MKTVRERFEFELSALLSDSGIGLKDFSSSKKGQKEVSIIKQAMRKSPVLFTPQTVSGWTGVSIDKLKSR